MIDTDFPNLINLLITFIDSSIFFKLLSISTEESDINREKIIFNRLKGLTQDEATNIFMTMYDVISKIIVDRKQNPVPDNELLVKFSPTEN
ncbi:hypothetical protein [uncultured Clostridium sp.]|uniref:hypothetical protein n=1 Tax=uncultured Clostridium sp. TaxID=59620 RepID=UPI0028E37F02|nr:hypothetical protein [uncultured Clostridium sp.]